MTSREREHVPPANAVKIVVQYRQKGATVYELESNGAALEVRICPVDDTAVSSGWRVDAQARSEQATPVEGWGTTPAEALGEVARAWNARCPALKIFDWEAIARVLQVVHAI